MAISASIFEAKTNLSQLLDQARQGHEVIITSGRSRTPVVRLEPSAPPLIMRLGALDTPILTPDPLFDQFSVHRIW